MEMLKKESKQVSKVVVFALVYDANPFELALLSCGGKITFVKRGNTCKLFLCPYNLTV